MSSPPTRPPPSVATYTQHVVPRAFVVTSFAGLVAKARVRTVPDPLRVKVRCAVPAARAVADVVTVSARF